MLIQPFLPKLLENGTPYATSIYPESSYLLVIFEVNATHWLASTAWLGEHGPSQMQCIKESAILNVHEFRARAMNNADHDAMPFSIARPQGNKVRTTHIRGFHTAVWKLGQYNQYVQQCSGQIYNISAPVLEWSLSSRLTQSRRRQPEPAGLA